MIEHAKIKFNNLPRIYLDACSLSPTDPEALELGQQALLARGRGLMAFEDPIIGKAKVHFRAQGAKLLNCRAEDISIIENVDHGSRMLADSFWRHFPKDSNVKVLFYRDEYPSAATPWDSFEWVVLPGSRTASGKSLRVGVEDFEKALIADPAIQIVVVSHAQFQSGQLIDIDALGAICKKHNRYYIVDAAQSLGAIPVDTQRCLADAIIAPGGKWLLGVEGIGILYTSARLRKLPNPWLGSDNRPGIPYEDCISIGPLNTECTKYEPSTLSYLNIAILGKAMEASANSVGVPAIWREIQRLQKLLLSKLDLQYFKLLPLPEGERSGILSFEVPDAVAIRVRAAAEGISLPVPRGGFLRIAIHYFNTDAQIDRASAVLNQLAKR